MPLTGWPKQNGARGRRREGREGGRYSAGSVVATRTLEGIELVDDPSVAPEGYDSEII
jgi:peptidase E